MYDAVALALENHLSIIETIPELETARQELKEKIALMERHCQTQEADNTSLTEDKNQFRAGLIVLLHRVAVAMTAYATTKKDVVLKAKVDYSITALRRKQDSTLYAISSMIYNLAIPFADDLRKYFVEPENLADLDRLTKEFYLALPLKQLATNVSKLSTIQIRDLHHEIDSLLKERIDILTGPFEFAAPDFFRVYRKCRKIVNYRGRGKENHFS